MLNNIVDNIELCGQQNIVHCCFQQPGCAIFAAIYGLVYTAVQENSIL